MNNVRRSASLRARSSSTTTKAANHTTNAANTPASPSSGSSTSSAPTVSCGLGGPRFAEHYRVEKSEFAKTRDPATNKSINDKTTVHYNDHITEAAYTYIVKGKPALEWVMER